MFDEILVTLDGSELAERALPYAREMAKQFGSRVTLMSVVESMTVYSQPGVVGPVVSVTMDMQDEAEATREYMVKLDESLKADGIKARRVIKEGDPAEQICDYAKESHIDLIVMCTHGRSGISRWVYGSVADKVLRGAEAPVLLIRAEAKPAG